MKNCKGFILIKKYPNSPQLGYFEPYTTGEYLKYPEYWRPVFETELFGIGDVIWFRNPATGCPETGRIKEIRYLIELGCIAGFTKRSDEVFKTKNELLHSQK